MLIKLSNQKISKYIFLVFIFFLPWQTRLILLSGISEYLSFSIYLSEIILWLALGFWISSEYKKIRLPILFFVFLVFTFISAFFAPDRVSAFRIWLYIFDGIMVYLYLSENKEYIAPAIKVFLASLFFVCGLAIYQFIMLGSPAFKWLGLATRGAWNLGDIVVIGEGGRWLRAYGSFPHPNILGGYLVVGILLLLYNSAKKIYCSTLWRATTYFLGGLFIFTLFITFSRSAWLALLVAVVYFAVKNFDKKNVRKLFTFSAILIFVLYFIFAPLIAPRIKAEGRLENKSNTERIESWREGVLVWKDNLIWGTGIGNYIHSVIPDGVGATSRDLEIPHQVRDDIDLQPKQPTHNTFLLILSELGLVGFLLYLVIWKKLWKTAKYILLLFLIIGFFDHYLWSLYSGQMLFWVGAGLIKE